MQPKSKQKAPSSSSAHKFSSSTVTASAGSPEKQFQTSSTPQQQPSVQKSNFEDWVGDEDDEYYYQGRPKQDRGGRKNKRKNKKGGQETRVWDWDDIYDPTLPNVYGDYKGSEEQYREIRDWKARLYYHQLKEAKKQAKNEVVDSNEEEGQSSRPMNRTCIDSFEQTIANNFAAMFAPPSNLSFAPPSFDDDARPPRVDDDDDDSYTPAPSVNVRDATDEPRAAFAHTPAPDDASGEDAYERRMRLSGMRQDNVAPLEATATATPAPPIAIKKPDVDMEAKRAEAQAKIAAFKAKLQKPAPSTAAAPPPPAISPAPQASLSPPPAAEEPGTTISRAPVRYQVPAADQDEAMADVAEAPPAEEQSKSNRPGQKGFAERLLKKYGWEKGQGLGATGEGITTAIVAKAEKRKKRSDFEGGGWAAPKNMGKIVGGKRRKVAGDNGDADSDARFGQMSEVVKLEGMLEGLDVQKEIEENNLMQEVGDEMGSQYGNVERLFIWRKEAGGDDSVFVKFTSQLSAVRAVNAKDGMTFAGNEVVARFWDADAFEKGEYA